MQTKRITIQGMKVISKRLAPSKKYFIAKQKTNKLVRLYEVIEELKDIRMLAQAENKDVAVLTAHNYIQGKQYRVVELSTKVFSI